jgi:hypothetical protein
MGFRAVDPPAACRFDRFGRQYYGRSSPMAKNHVAATFP